jgi:hypothetical protein
MFLAIALIGIAALVFYKAYLDTQEEQERLRQQAYQEYRDMIYHWDNDCSWCGKEYKIKDGSEYFCSPKCEHQHHKANKQ